MKGTDTRCLYDLDHWSHVSGNIGSLQTLSAIPVVAGDSMELNFTSLFRLSPLRRNLYLDAMVDLFAFYVPYRHVYGDTWIDFIKEGYDESQTLGTYTIAAGEFINCTGAYLESQAVIPKWSIASYTRIWNRYFRHPTDSNEKDDDDLITASSGNQIYGYNCCHMKNIWSTGVDSELTDDDHKVDVTASKVDLLEIIQKKARFKTERQREWFGQRYTDILDSVWGSNVNIDADERPELIMRTSTWLSGYDVDGTTETNIGTFSGKAFTTARLQFPMKYFNEHGTIYIVALVRFPTIHAFERHYLFGKSEPTYKEIAGDPNVIRNEPPQAINPTDYIENATATDVGLQPYAQWYRTHPSYTSLGFSNLDGHPFLQK